MQTFLPYRDFTRSAQTLDYRRLGKQRVEGLQLLEGIFKLTVILVPPTYIGWINHPCARMWRPYPNLLMDYTRTMCREWISRGYKDTILQSLDALSFYADVPGEPPWMNEEFHASHRALLYAKDPSFYRNPASPDSQHANA